MGLSIKVENSRLYIRTAAIIKSSDGYILEKENSEGYAFLIGGKLKINELSRDGVKREIMEEISFEANDLKLLQVIENILNNREEGKEDIHEICFVYV